MEEFRILNIIVLQVLVAFTYNTIATCPDGCKCVNSNLDCSHNELRIVPNRLDRNTDILDLSNNSIKFLHKTSFVNMPNLWKVLLSSNKINFIHEQTFYELKHLRILILSDNEIKILYHDMFVKNTCLQYLDLSKNTNLLVPSATALFKVPSLVSLILSGCNLNHLSAKTFSQIGNLQSLDISDNNLKTLVPDMFRTLRHLKQLKVAKIKLMCNCVLQEINKLIREVKICVLGRKCYKHDISVSVYWDDLTLTCPISPHIRQSKEGENIQQVSTRAGGKCSNIPELNNFTNIPSECEKTEKITISITKAPYNTTIASKMAVLPVTLTTLRAFSKPSTISVSSTTLKDVSKLSTTEPLTSTTLEGVSETSSTPMTLIALRKDTTISTTPLTSTMFDNLPISNITSITSMHILFISLGVCGTFIVIAVIVCMLTHNAQEKQRKRDAELFQLFITTLLKKETDQQEHTSNNYYPTPSLHRSAQPYLNLPLVGYENNRPASSEDSYLEPIAHVEPDVRQTVSQGQFIELRQCPESDKSKTLNQREHFESQAIPLFKRQSFLENNGQRSAVQLSIVESHRRSYDSEDHIYEEID